MTNEPASSSGDARTPVTLDAIFELRIPSDAQIAPDGQRVAFVLSEWVAQVQRTRGRIWLAGAAGGDAQPLAGSGPDGENAPRWSPDGTRLAFISKRDDGEKARFNDKAQLYVMPADGGQAMRACSMPDGASEPEWSPDGSRIAFLSLEGDEPADGPKVNEPLRHRRLWTVHPGSDAPQPVTPANCTIWRYAWAPDGASLAVYFSEGPGETDWYRGQIGIVPAAGGAVRRITQLTRQADALAWSRDGQTLYFIAGEWSDRGLVGGDICAVAAVGGEPRNLTPEITFSPSWVFELPDRRLLFAAWDGLSGRVGVLDPANGALTTVTPDFIAGDFGWPRLSATPDGARVAAIHTDGQHPWNVWLGEWEGAGRLAWRPLTHLNAIAEETLRIAPTERMRFAAADGQEIEALYTPPLEPLRGTPPPLFVNVHGGPTSAFRDVWLDRMAENLGQLMAAAGFAVLRINPRGSIGRGVAFADAVLGDMGGGDFDDIQRGIDTLVDRGLADPDRLAIFGWSYGGFMTAWAVTQTTRFKVAVMGAGVCDFHSFHAQSNIPDWDVRIIGASPHERPEAYRERSAISNTGRVTTPTLILHGEQDPCVPVNQAQAFYRALRERGVPTELAIYPREGHGIRERDHLRDLYGRIQRWVEHYV
ncbi:MAG: prolyl oligopeptidase family serine peptidase [Ktedonobacterales bacterium]